MIVKVIRANWNLQRDNGDEYHALGLRITTGRWRKKTRTIGIYGRGNKWYYDADEPNVGDPFKLSEEIKKAIHAARKKDGANLGLRMPKQIKPATADGKSMFSGNLLPAFSDTDEPVECGEPGVAKPFEEEIPEESINHLEEFTETVEDVETSEYHKAGKARTARSTRFVEEIKKTPRKPLTDAKMREAVVRLHDDAGLTTKEIAKMLAKSLAWVVSVLQKATTKKAFSLDEFKEQSREGASKEDIAESFGLTVSELFERVDAVKIEDKFPGETEIAKVIRLGKEHDPKVISTMLGISWIRVKGILSGKIKEPFFPKGNPCGEVTLTKPEPCQLGSLVRGGFATFTDDLNGLTRIVVILEVRADDSHIAFVGGTLWVHNRLLNGYYPKSVREHKELMEKLWPKTIDHTKQWKQWDGRILNLDEIGDEHLDRIITMLGSGNSGHCTEPSVFRSNAITHRLWRKENDLKVEDDLKNYAMYRSQRGCTAALRDYGDVAPWDEED